MKATSIRDIHALTRDLQTGLPSSLLRPALALLVATVVVLAAGCDSGGTGPYPPDDSDPGSQTLPPHFEANLTGVWGSSSAVADVNGDEHPDLLITGEGGTDSSFTPTSTLYLGNGDGTFSRADIDLPGVAVYTSASIEDVDGDGNRDLLITGEDGRNAPAQALYLGDGTGSFSEASADLEGGENGQSAITDFNVDGTPDLLITGRLPIESRVYLGNGDGTFSKIETDLPGVTSGSPAIADFNGDDIPDLVLTGVDIDGNPITELYLGNGDGTFTEANAKLAPVVFSSASAADVNEDGHKDLLLTGIANYPASSFTSSTTLYLGNGDGSFSEANADLVDVSFSASSIADVNGDGHSDILVTGRDTDTSRVSKLYLGKGDGDFSEADAGLLGASEGSVSTADVDQDQDLDLLITGQTAYADTVLPKSILYENVGDWNADSN